MKVFHHLLRVLFVLLIVFSFSLLGCQNAEAPKEKKPLPKPKDEILWGIDTASIIDQSFYQCVVEHFGKPVVAGRYLGTKDGVSYGLTQEEIELLHSQNINLLLIYNHFTDARGYSNGKKQAQEAVALAQELGVPKGVALFANIEPIYPVDAEFIRGWVETLSLSPYHPAIYGDFSEGHDVRKAFLEAVNINQKIMDITIVWTHQPQEGITTKENAPSFHPGAPAQSKAWIWQYGIDAETCNIDTNLLRKEVLDYLW